MLNEEFVLARVREHETGQDTRRGGGPAQARGGSAGRGSGPARGTGPGGAPARTAPGREAPDGNPYDANDPVVNLERQALKLAIQRPALCGPVFDMLQKDDFSVPVHGSVRELIAGCGGVAGAGTDREWAARLIDAAPNDRAREFVTRLAVEPVETPRAASVRSCCCPSVSSLIFETSDTLAPSDAAARALFAPPGAVAV
jgi:DNA primase